MARTTLGLLAVLLTLTAPARAEDLVQRLADGAPWTTIAPNGGPIQIVFHPDGTGRVGRGMFSRRLTWDRSGDQICLSGLPGAASGCMVLIESIDGLVGLRPDGTELRLWR